ncbi:MAG: hypothetical protein RLZ28_1385 [Actinomycetota bacterium]
MSSDSRLLASLNLNEKVLSHPSLARAENQLDLFCSVAWSHITEPGDEFAGLLRTALGPAEALALLVSGASQDIWLNRISEAGFLDAATERFGNAADTLRDSLARWRQRLSLATVLASLDEATRLDIHLVSPNTENWPDQLSVLEFASPALLWVRGHTETLKGSEKSWAVVGCRTPTSYGQDVTHALVQGLADSELAIVSGGAFGIDAIAHHAALICQTPTIAVMAGGVDRLYPRTNENLLNKIISNGAVLSEVALGVAPTKWRFLQRNRIIAALGGGTVVVEAGYRSGAINTANHAISMLKPVAAVPGSVLSSRSAGCNRLISEGHAQLVTSAADLLSIYPGTPALEVFAFDTMAPLETRTYDSIGFRAATIEQICQDAGLTLSEATQAIASLLTQRKVFQRGASYLRA